MPKMRPQPAGPKNQIPKIPRSTMDPAASPGRATLAPDEPAYPMS